MMMTMIEKINKNNSVFFKNMLFFLTQKWQSILGITSNRECQENVQKRGLFKKIVKTETKM